MSRLRQTRGSDSELAYASPASPFWTEVEVIEDENQRNEPGRMGNDGRKRRYRGYADDKGDTVDGFITEVDRADGPYLCSIPIETTPDFRPRSLTARVWIPRPRIIQRIEDILQEFGVEYSQPPKFVGRQSVLNPEHVPTFTCVVFCVGNSSQWLGAAKKILKLIREDEQLTEASVELLNPSLNYAPVENARILQVPESMEMDLNKEFANIVGYGTGTRTKGHLISCLTSCWIVDESRTS
ncbi:hypothetical protein N7478_004124 [Penicillium angulare]|uniref:uncharacterized protein n=1 Tax=Penicillium angulare TaxID=116970 RepID=UPI0025425E51|nr:uncharacterized protein N7478_004124 [Penicillium angulare]KAJ5278752.1 hypothetical protein N7478_004124 [Penicillium angulare]